MAKTNLTAERLRELLDYNPATGIFTRKISIKWNSKVGDVAGFLHHTGYWSVRIDNKEHAAHRLVWLYVHGYFPENQIDHINGQRTDNRLFNLREATHAENQQNYCLRKNNKSGFTGVCFFKDRNVWLASITVNRKQIGLGHFSTPELASEAYKKAKASLHTFNPIPRD